MRLFLLAGCVLSACATTKTAAVPAPAAEPKKEAAADPAAAQAKLQAQFARESAAAPAQSFTVKGHTFSSESSGPIEVVADEGAKSTRLTLGVGASTKVTCYLFDAPVDVGALVARTLGNVRKTLTIARVHPSGVEVVEKSPAVFLEIGYFSERNGGRVVGELKFMATSSDDAPLMCFFDEPGYTQSFRRVTRELAAALGKGLASPAEGVTFRAISISRIGPLDVGFGLTEWKKRADGVMVLRSATTMLVPRSPTEWLTTDSVSVTELEKDFTVKTKTSVTANNGDIDKKLVLSHGKGGEYSVKGTMQGKDLEGTMKTRDGKGLASDVLQNRAVREQLLTGKKAELTMEDYVSEANPLAFTPVTVRRAAPPKGITLEVGPMKVEAEADDDGMPEKIKIQAGPVELREERVFVEGHAR